MTSHRYAGNRRRYRLWNLFPFLVLFVFISHCALFLVILPTSFTKENDQSLYLQSRDIRTFIRPQISTTRISPKADLTSKHLLLTAVVPSAPANFHARQAIRQTWGNYLASRTDTKIVFLLGSTSDNEIQEMVLEESEKFDDIIEESFVDSYFNLTLKTVFLLKWVAQHCPQTKFVLKVDDDMFLEPSNLMQFLQTELSNPKLFTGFLHIQRKPFRDPTSKWYLPEAWYEDHVLPSFISGTAYLFSGQLVRQLYNTALDTQFINLEDVFLSGIVASHNLGINLTHNKDFHRNSPVIGHPCLYKRLITVHEVNPQDLRNIWNHLPKDNQCDDSFYVRILETIFQWMS